MSTRFRYKNSETKSAFVELAATSPAATPEQLYEWLIRCDLVERVEWQTSKTSQGNIGDQKSERNIKVFPQHRVPAFG